jgi:TPR repeat protein
MRLLKLLLVLCVCVAAMPAVAGPYEDAVSAYSQGDYRTALDLYQPLADQGDARAQHNLGVMYANGQGVPQDQAAAVSWWRRAAEQGLAKAQGALGVMYERGEGVRRDLVQAHKWYHLAASRLELSEKYREISFRRRDLVAAKMTPAQIAEAEKLAREWKPTPER